MFLQQAMNPWFAVHRASQVTMILLAGAILVMPLLYQPEEADAVGPLGIVVVAGFIGLGGVLLGWELASCSECGKNGAGTSHRTTCPKGHTYYDCQSSNVWLHEPCHEESSS